MKNVHYQPSSRFARSFAAVAAIATVVALFEVVSGLGDTKEEALAALNVTTATPTATIASADAHTAVAGSVLQ